MKAKLFALALGVIVTLPGVGLAAKSDELSVISAYAGSYNGTATLSSSSSSTAFFGTVQARFTASKKKENGSLSLNALFFTPTAVPILESYGIRKRALSYLLTASTSTVPGSGSVKVGKNRITYSAVIPISGGPYLLFGSMSLSKRRLTINETLIIGSTTNFLSYTLKRSGKK